MNFPLWVKSAIEEFKPPLTGRVEIGLELYNGGVTKMEIGSSLRIKADGDFRDLDPTWCRKCGHVAIETWYICASCDKAKLNGKRI